MCGIAGFVDRSEPDAGAVLRRMLGLIEHRGPDGEGTHFQSTLGLAVGMRRLSIIDIEGGWQPIWNEDRTVAVVLNGEIYNYLELRRELEASGHQFRTNSDTEVLVHLYEDLAERMTTRLRGMFAFCIFDQKNRSLLLARDHFGQKPLYFSAREGRFAFASELKCLLTLPWVRDALRPDAFLSYAAWLSLPSPLTHFQDVTKVEPGQVLRVSLDEPDAVRSVGTWRYDLNGTPDLIKIEDAADALDAALTESVRMHLRSDVPVGVLLSSGLDSRTILAYASAIQGSMQTFTVGFGAADSELQGAAETAREIGSRHHAIELGPSDFSESIGKVAHLLDEPIGDPASFAVLRVCELARGHVKVLLSGEGSDELFGGYDGRYAGMLTTMERSRMFRHFGIALPSGTFANPSRWKRFCARAHSTRESELTTLRIEGLPGDVTQPRGLTIAQITALQHRAQIHGSSVFRSQRDALSEFLAFDIRWQLAESLLQKADKMSMGASIELRSPLLDREIAAIAARIPSSFKLPPGGPGKLVLRKTLNRKLHEQMNRPKQGFPVPLNDWFAGPLRDQVDAELFAQNSAVSSLLDRTLLRKAWEDLLAGRWDGGRVMFSLWLYETWRRTVRK